MAALARDLFEAERSRAAGWAEAPAHQARVLSLYGRAATETSAFEELLVVLAVDPATGVAAFLREDDIASRPGIGLLPPGWPGQLREAAWSYLHQATPPGEDCLDHPDTWSLTAETGHLAFAMLAHCEAPDRTLPSLSSGIVAAWAPAILSIPVGTGHFGVKRILLTRLAQAVPDILPGLISRLLLGHLSTRVWPSSLEPLDAACTEAAGDVIAGHLAAVTGALRATIASPPQAEGAGRTVSGGPVNGQREQQLWAQRREALQRTFVVLTRILACCQHGAGIQSARSIITQATAREADEASRPAGRACAAGLIAGDAAHWPDILSQLEQAPRLLRDVLQDLALDPDSSLLPSLTDNQLAELWELLAQRWPYQHDAPWSSGYVPPDQQARHWRDAVLATLARRGTSNTVQVLTRLAASHPGPPWLADRLREAEALEREYGWVPLRPEELTRLIHDSRSRLVRNDSDLADLAAAAITDAAGSLTRTGQLLWNNHTVNGTERWRPKSEPDVGAWLDDQLTRQLADSGVIISREVLVRQVRPQGLGLTVDIQADAPTPVGQDTAPARCRIELKGNWNPDLMTAMQAQLAEDYLLTDGLRDGIYLTAWFDTSLWNDPQDTRRARAASRDRQATAQELLEQAEHLHHRGLRIRSQIIDIPRPAPSPRSTAPHNAAGGPTSQPHVPTRLPA